jgi:hypothetical protein
VASRISSISANDKCEISVKEEGISANEERGISVKEEGISEEMAGSWNFFFCAVGRSASAAATKKKCGVFQHIMSRDLNLMKIKFNFQATS